MAFRDRIDVRQRTFKQLLTLLLLVGGALVSAALGIAAYVVYALNGPQPHSWRDHYTFSPFETDVTWENVAFPAEDGVVLRGWWLPRPEVKSVAIGLTGHKGGKHELLGIGSGLWREGNNVLLFDFRGCGDSDAAPLSLAHKELADARAAVSFVMRRLPGARIGFVGFSMGAAVAILEAAANGEVRAVVADSSFAGMSEVVAAALLRRRLPARFLVPISDVLNRWRHGYPFRAVRPIDAIGALAPRPIFLIHGSDDGVTPVEHAYRLYTAAGAPKELWVSEGAPHCGAYFQNRELYVRRVAEFFERYV